MDAVSDGDVARASSEGELWRNGERSPRGAVMTAPEIEAAMEEARSTIGTELERFAVNTLEYIQQGSAS